MSIAVGFNRRYNEKQVLALAKLAYCYAKANYLFAAPSVETDGNEGVVFDA